MIYKYPRSFAHIKKWSLREKIVEEHIADAEKLAREHEGVLPNPKWLEENGYSKLRDMIYKHSERFAHIKRMIRNKIL
jgi:hypothetical protein